MLDVCVRTDHEIAANLARDHAAQAILPICELTLIIIEHGLIDQKFNLMRGRDLQRHFGQPQQIILMNPILEGLDGVQKMSKSLNNAIGIHEPPAEMYGKLMSISDDLMWKYWIFLTDLRQSEVKAMQEAVSAGSQHPMDIKKTLAQTITAGFHGEAAAEALARQTADDWTEFLRFDPANDTARNNRRVVLGYAADAAWRQGHLDDSAARGTGRLLARLVAGKSDLFDAVRALE